MRSHLVIADALLPGPVLNTRTSAPATMSERPSAQTTDRLTGHRIRYSTKSARPESVVLSTNISIIKRKRL